MPVLQTFTIAVDAIGFMIQQLYDHDRFGILLGRMIPVEISYRNIANRVWDGYGFPAGVQAHRRFFLKASQADIELLDQNRDKRWIENRPFRMGDETWYVTNQWGGTEEILGKCNTIVAAGYPFRIAKQADGRYAVSRLDEGEVLENVEAPAETYEEMTARLAKLLRMNRNVILHGAPGTGKTYIARGIGTALGQLMGGAAVEVKTIQFHQSYDYSDFVEGLRPYELGNQVSFKRQDGSFKEFCKKAVENPETKFVMVIDEINRGELSKIFGELFFAIDPGYRGICGRIDTQYKNMIEVNDVFKDGFYVPENMYIIGTMNDIDRSVESMDLAMRRRFAFEEITAKQSQCMFDNASAWKNEAGEVVDVSANKAEIISRMNSLNEKICDPSLNLGSAYHIGGAYFLKFSQYKREGEDQSDAFEDLWNFHISGTLKEYLRGMPDAAGLLADLKEEYNCM